MNRKLAWALSSALAVVLAVLAARSCQGDAPRAPAAEPASVAQGPPERAPRTRERPRAKPTERSGGETDSGTPPVPPGPDLRVRDLRTHQPVASFALMLKPDDGDETQLTTSSEGWCSVPPELRDRIRSVDPGFRVVYRTEQDPEHGEPVLWIARVYDIVGRVVGRDGRILAADLLEHAEAGVFFMGDPSRPFAESGPRDEHAWRERAAVPDGTTIAPNGTFRARSILPPEFGVYVQRVSGHRTAVVRVPDSLPSEGTWHVDVLCLPVRRFTLRFTDEDGEPLPGVRVHVTSVREVPRQEASRVLFHRPQGGYGYVAGADSVTFKWHAYGESGDDGVGEMEIGEPSRAVISAYVPGRELVQSHVEPGDGDVSRTFVMRSMPETPPVRILLDGEPLRHSHILVNDTRDSTVSVTLPMHKTDSRGLMPTHYLEHGIRYRVGAAMIRGLPQVEVVWGGQEQLELE